MRLVVVGIVLGASALAGLVLGLSLWPSGEDGSQATSSSETRSSLSRQASRARFFFGFSSDDFKYEPAAAVPAGLELGAEAARVTLLWSPGQTTLAASDAAAFDSLVETGRDLRIVVAVYAASNESAPVDEVAREQYCSYVRSLLRRYPSINDVVIWNEPNKQFFWKPQYDLDGGSASPAVYGALLARCWDLLHALRPEVNVIAPATSPKGNDKPFARSNVSHSPGSFIRKLGEAYRASGRARPLFDTVGHHSYGLSAAEPPSKDHPGSTISQGDYRELIEALRDAFTGTAQPLPGECRADRCVAIWYLEAGYQTRIDEAKAALYTGSETDAHAVSDLLDGETAGPAPAGDVLALDQSTQIADGVRLAFCQPYVGAFFNFMLWDEPDLRGWQSGPFWVDRTPKDSFPAFERVIAQAKTGAIDCEIDD